MPQQAWSDKRERQYEHIKEGLKEQGRSNDLAEEIAARTVNKERARHGEAKEPSRSSTEDISSGRRGGLRSHTGPGGRTRDQLYEEAKRKNIRGRSKMTKAELKRAVDRYAWSGLTRHRGPAFGGAPVARDGTRERRRISQPAAGTSTGRRPGP
jgi:plasmid stabilization system protein ParE